MLFQSKELLSEEKNELVRVDIGINKITIFSKNPCKELRIYTFSCMCLQSITTEANICFRYIAFLLNLLLYGLYLR